MKYKISLGILKIVLLFCWSAFQVIKARLQIESIPKEVFYTSLFLCIIGGKLSFWYSIFQPDTEALVYVIEGENGWIINDSASVQIKFCSILSNTFSKE